jgi:23S rRNA (adenine2503-C2)-methyltransferase
MLSLPRISAFFAFYFTVGRLCTVLFFSSASDALTLKSGQRIPSRNSSVKDHDTSYSQPFPSADDYAEIGIKAQTAKSLFHLLDVEDWGTRNGLKEHHLKTLYRVLLNSPPSPFQQSESKMDMGSAKTFKPLEERLMEAGFPKRHAANLLSQFGYTCSIVRVEESDSGGYKFVVQLPSGKLVETVLIRHERRNGNVRYTVCVSSQVGCAKKCSFCATGTMGLQGQLTSGEILEQVLLAKNYLAANNDNQNNHQIRNCVFMGMGEPLDNYDEVHEALRGLTHQCLFGLKAKHVTISTVGASAKRIRQLADDAPQVSLALSLHSAVQKSREKLIPSATANPIGSLGEALDYHSGKSGGRGAMLEYLLIDGVNDSDVEVDALANFCQERITSGGKVFVNLIPYNPTLAGDDFGYETPSDDRINAFHDRLKSLGVKSLVRWSSASGRDANGACGQLALSSP